jgi:hypothetical protein
VVKDVNNSDGDESQEFGNGQPCYNHNSFPTLLDANNISWKYYAHAKYQAQGSNPATSLWTAPNAIEPICGPVAAGQCTGPDWSNYVASVFPNATGYPNSFSPILTDLGADPNQPQCTLPGVSWVIPDGAWSDHGGDDPHGAGPSWVAAIVNAVGGYNNSGGKLSTNCQYWQNTVVLITWDDWGGWYDHILPWQCNPGPGGVCLGYDSKEDGKFYMYGFRVPLLVVSAYTGTYSGGNWSGYISGALPSPGKVAPYVHDFGSILNFIEYAFGQNGQPIGEIYPTYHYADYYAPDAPNGITCNGIKCRYSLSDFFPTNFTHPRTFKAFTQNVNYPTQCFLTPSTTPDCFGPGFAATDPDADNVDVQD